MSDRHILLKQCMKEIADRIGMSVTFMAKPHEEQAGSSCQIHLSLWQNDRNIFSGSEQYGDIRCSKEFLWFLGGWMKFVPDVMVFYAPTINAYKRYVSGSWAPTRLAASRDNRTAGFRIVGSGKKSTYRVSNPRCGLQSLSCLCRCHGFRNARYSRQN